MAEQTETPQEAEAKSPWKIIVEPIGDNGVSEKKKNKGGMAVFLTSTGGAHQEVTRIAFERKNSSHPETSFEDQLRESVETARAALAILREQLTWDGELQ